MGKRLDSYSRYPSGMEEYLENYGWHFSKKMCEWAISLLKKENASTKKIENFEEMLTKEQIDELFKRYNIKLVNKHAYDYCYILHWYKATAFKTSIDDDPHLLKLVKDYFDNVNSYDEIAFTRFYGDCIANGEAIIWEDML